MLIVNIPFDRVYPGPLSSSCANTRDVHNKMTNKENKTFMVKYNEGKERKKKRCFFSPLL